MQENLIQQLFLLFNGQSSKFLCSLFYPSIFTYQGRKLGGFASKTPILCSDDWLSVDSWFSYCHFVLKKMAKINGH